MTRFLVRRLRDGLLVVLIVLLAVFVLGNIIGDPASAIAGEDATDEEIAQIAKVLGTDRSLGAQLVDYFSGVPRGDFGESIRQSRPAVDVVMDGLGNTLLLAVAGLIVGASIGVIGGMIAGTRPESVFDRGANFLSVFAISVPNFWLGLLLITVFAVNLGLVPTSGFFDWKGIILPAVTLGIVRGGRIFQVVRSAVFDEMTKPYVTVVRAKGLPRNILVWKHVFRNSGVTMSTAVGWEFVRMVGGGLFTVEIVFGWPGIGLTMINAANLQDFAVLQAGTIIMAVFVIFSNALIDIIYRIFDRRVQAA